MKNKIGLNSLAASLAISTGRKKEICELFLQNFFAIISEQLEAGDEVVKIKDFGTFRIGYVEARKSVNISTGVSHEIPSHKKLLFIPSKKLASIVNKAFEPFEAVVMAESLSLEEISQAIEEGEENLLPEYDLEIGSEEEEADDIFTAEAYTDLLLSEVVGSERDDKKIPSQSFINNDKESEIPKKKEVISTSKNDKSEIEAENLVMNKEEEADIIEKKDRGRFLKGFLVGLFSALLICGVIFVFGFLWGDFEGNKKYGKQSEKTISSAISTADNSDTEVLSNIIPMSDGDVSGIEADTEESDIKVVYDTVSPTRYLTIIAREHYGNFNMWPYIYEENKDILGHPDRIKPGTRVVVPTLSKYGVDAKSKEDTERAKKLGAEIYSRFK